MKVKRIITTIEIEDNNNSITPVELTKLYLDNYTVPLAITNISTNGSASNIDKVYNAINDDRISISHKLRSIAESIDDALTQSDVRGESPTE